MNQIDLGPPWVVYNKSNSPLVDNKINAITIDSEGKVWFATNDGASHIRKQSWGSIKDSLNYFTYDAGGNVYITRTVTSIAQGKDGSLWFGLLGGGVRRFNKFSQTKVWQSYAEPSIASSFVQGVAAERLQVGDVWCVTLAGASRFIPSEFNPDQGVWYTYTTSNTSQLPSNQLRAVAVNPNDNSIWFGTHDGSVVSYDGDIRWGAYHIPPPYDYPISSIAFDITNKIWVGRWEGASSFDPDLGIWTHYTYETTDRIIPHGPVRAVATDFYTTRWFGTNAGLIRLRDTTWTTFNRSNSPLPSDTVSALLYDTKGNLWIGTMNGVAVFNEQGTRF
ncbi:MAG TPA: two-component regulator propeller domain-containing protein [Bacteroidota bacterium]|nr:two-component regulator propeller domain-containing protein [Bacteroidota bacterium]